MTKVNITYNPFTKEAEIIVNGVIINNDSSPLFQYHNMPMQDWGNFFLQDLIGCCDDKIEILFHGLQFSYNILEGLVQSYIDNNPKVLIVLKVDLVKSQFSRMGTLLSLKYEILKTQDVIEEIKIKDAETIINRAFEAYLDVVVVSENNHLKAKLINELIGTSIVEEGNNRGTIIINDNKINHQHKIFTDNGFDLIEYNIPFSSSKHCTLKIVDTPNSEDRKECYFNYIKRAISSPDKPIIVFILDRNHNNCEEFLNMISQEIDSSGKQNKERFIFVAEDVLSASKCLYNDYIIKDACIVHNDDICTLQGLINKYMYEYSLINKISLSTSVIESMLKETENALSKDVSIMQSNQDNYDSLILLEEEVKNVEFKTKLPLDDNFIRLAVYALRKRISNEFRNVMANNTDVSYNTTNLLHSVNLFGKTKESQIVTKEYIKDRLQNTIHDFLVNTSNMIINKQETDVVFSSKLENLLQRLDKIEYCNKDLWIECISKKSNQDMAFIEEIITSTLKEIEGIEIKQNKSSFRPWMMMGKLHITPGFTSDLENGSTYIYNFYDALVELIQREIDLGIGYDLCHMIFTKKIKLIEPILIDGLRKICAQITIDEAVCETVKNQFIQEIKGQLEAGHETIIKSEETLVKNNIKLQYVRKLIKDLNDVVKV